MVIAKCQDKATKVYYGLTDKTFRSHVIEENFRLTDRGQFIVLSTSNRSTKTNSFQTSVALSHCLKTSENIKAFLTFLGDTAMQH